MSADRARTTGRPRRTEIDEAIRDAARRVLISDGYGDLTIEGVARLAGVGKPTIYRRHDSKAALVADALVDLLDAANPEPPDTGDVADDFRRLLRKLVEVLTTTDFGPAITEIVSPASRDADLAHLFSSLTSERRELIRVVMQRASEQGRLVATDVETAIDLALGAIYFRHLISGDQLDADYVESVVGAIISSPTIAATNVAPVTNAAPTNRPADRGATN